MWDNLVYLLKGNFYTMSKNRDPQMKHSWNYFPHNILIKWQMRQKYTENSVNIRYFLSNKADVEKLGTLKIMHE